MATKRPTCLDVLKKYASEGHEQRSSAQQEEDVMERLNNTLNMQSSTSYERIPRFHREAMAECIDALKLPAVRPYFTASVFLKMTKDMQGTISIPSFHHYIVRKNAMLQTMIHMGCFDTDGDGAVTEAELQAYIAALVPELPGLRGLDQSMAIDTYAQMAARKFLFFLGKQGKVRIRDIVMSPMWYELMELRVEADPQQAQESWFSRATAERMRNTFFHLDQDMNGHLSKQEFCANTVGSFSPMFLDRVYEEHATSHKSRRGPGYPNQMDFGAFLDFMLAWDNRNSWAGIQYFFPVLDLKGRGYLTQTDVYIFFRQIYKMWVECGLYPELSVEDVKDEVFDMAQPTHLLHITIQDLQKCGMAATIIGMLADVNLFWEYDNRETLMQRDKEESGK
ncbi:hypothetical protein ABBQ38_001822 [Trebouxia sp. C0009 RCD-2024]